MKQRILIVFLFFIAAGSSCFAQVHFNNITIEQAMQRAKIEGKHIFIDTYAPWCKPCKKLEPIFKDREVASLLNQNFICVRINADDPAAADFKNRYRVVFLPTLLFLDRNGAIKVKVDKVISKYELISFANHALHSNVVYNSMTILDNPTQHTKPSQTNPTLETAKPMVKKEVVSASKPVTKTTTRPAETKPAPNTPKEDEKILYVLDEALDAPPEILYQEAYFRMQLMDGSHWDVARQYLSTQYDWSTEKNMRFIFDFLRDTDSDDFKYYIDNKADFIELFGERQVELTTEIVVETKLTQGYPRPDLNKAITLYGYLDPENAIDKAYRYSIGRSYEERKFDEFEEYATQYLFGSEKKDKDVMYLYAAFVEYQYDEKSKLNRAVDLIEECVAMDNSRYDYFETLAKLHFKLKNKQKALLAAQRGIDLAQKQGASQANLMILMEDIEQL